MPQRRARVRLTVLWTLSVVVSFTVLLCSSWPVSPVAAATLAEVEGPTSAFSALSTPVHYPPDRDWDLHHVALRVRFEHETRTVHGDVTLSVEALSDELTTLELDAVDLEILATTIEGLPAPPGIRNDGQRLRLDWADPVDRGTWLDVRIRYRARPRLGIYFRDEPRQVWSQGAAEQTRHWIPLHDYPNDRTSSEMWITVDDGEVALAAGELRTVLPLEPEITAEPGPPDATISSLARSAAAIGQRYIFHWRQEEPHPTYLLTVAVGRFQVQREILEHRGRRLPFSYYLPLGHPWFDASNPTAAEEGWRRNFGAMPEMLSFLSDYLDAPYPFAKYAQILVSDFPWGGMENISATTLTDRALHTERSLLDHRISHETLLVHELAHQWLGNWVSCREWSEVWLNEGFTTYLAALYIEDRFGTAAFDLHRRQLLEGYLAEAANAYQRPVISRRYPHPEDLYDRHTYFKGALVLHVLRQQLGADRFRRVLRRYVVRYAAESVDTQDFLDVLEAETGKRHAALFDRWIYRAGHPELEVRAEFRASTSEADPDAGESSSAGTIIWTVRQLQAGAADAPFPIETHLEAHTGGRVVRRPLRFADAVTTVSMEVPAPPEMLLFDPGRHLLASVTFDKDTNLLLHQLRHATGTLDRLDAAEALVLVEPNPAVLAALTTAVDSDPVSGVRAAAARTLGQLAEASTLPVLTTALEQEHPKVRAAAATALSGFPADSQATALLQALIAPATTADASFEVQKEAMLSLAMVLGEAALPTLNAALEVDSWHDEIRVGALHALTSLVRSGALESETRTAVVELALQRAGTRTRSPERPFEQQAAFSLLAVLGRQKEDPRILDLLVDAAQAGHLQVRTAAIRALGLLGDLDALPTLRQLAADEPQRRLQRTAILSLRRLQPRPDDDDEKLREHEEELEQTLRDVRRRLRTAERRQEREN